MIMKALSIQEPFAYCILYGGKRIENRSRPVTYRGPLLIHASKRELRDQVEDALRLVAITQGREYVEVLAHYLRVQALGSLVGRVNLTEVTWTSDSPWFFGPVGYVLADPEVCTPRAHKGARGLFNVPSPVVQQLEFVPPAAVVPLGGAR